MSEKTVEKRLQQAYEKLLETVLNLVEKEGKTLKEALAIGKQKLSDFEELSREEADRISREVSRDLSSLGEAVLEVKDALREKLAIDSIYLTENALKLLGKVADKTTVELSRFTEELREKARAYDEQWHAKEHQEHRDFESEHALWLDEIELWQKEHAEAQTKLMGVQEALRKHGEALQEHAQTIRAHQAREQEHEADIALREQRPDDETLLDKEEQDDLMHHEMAEVHRKQAELHQKLKRHHQNVMVLIEKLHKAAAAH